MRLTPLRALSLLLLGVIIIWVAGSRYASPACVTAKTVEELQGSSLSGLVENGERVVIAHGYYGCERAVRGDLAVYKDPAAAYPIVKIVKAIGGDSFTLALSEGGAKLLVNGEAARNSFGEVYRFSDAAFNLLSLYERDYGGVIPEQSVLVLGNLRNGTRDSSQFGLLAQADLLGKVVAVKR